MSYEVLKILNKYHNIDETMKFEMASEIVGSFKERDDEIVSKLNYLIDLMDVMDKSYVSNVLKLIKNDVVKWQK